MSSFLRSPSQPSTLQQTIEKITDGSQNNEDWALIMSVCDYAGAREESAKETMKIIRKRLQVHPNNHNWRTTTLTLTLLEALTKNCGKVFHLQIAHRDFLKELKGVIGPKTNPPLPIQQRVLGMIQTWALAFRHDPDLKHVEQFYQECKEQGLQFPPPEPESIIKAAVPPTGTMDRPLQQTRSMPATGYSTSARLNRVPSEGSPHPRPAAQGMTADQVAKLRSELDVVQTNAQVFGEMLVTLQPGEENPQDFELLMELRKTCQQMHARIVDLLAQITIDDITVDLLRYNDELNNSFKTFDTYMQQRERRFNGSARPSQRQSVSPPTRTVDNVPALIRFDDDPEPLSSGFQNMHLPTNIPPSRAMPVHQDPDRDAEEMEQWLKVQGDNSELDPVPRRSEDTSAAFNNFLQKRASTIPSEPTTDHLYSNIQPTSNRIDQANTRM